MHQRDDGRADVDLVARSQCGDDQAFAELYRRHASAVRRALSDNVHDRDRQDDLLQEVFAKGWANIAKLSDPERFRAWMFQIARNLAIDDLRARMRMPLDELDDVMIENAPSDDPALVSEVWELATALRDRFVTLAPRDAAALSMAVNLGFGPAEIAAALDISYGNAKVVLHRARRRLREAVIVASDGDDRSSEGARR